MRLVSFSFSSRLATNTDLDQVGPVFPSVSINDIIWQYSAKPTRSACKIGY